MSEEMKPAGDPATHLERELAALTPAAVTIDRDAVLFAAGRASAGTPRRVWPWQAATGALAAMAAVLACVALLRPEVAAVPGPVVRTAPQSKEPARPAVDAAMPDTRDVAAVPPALAAATERYLRSLPAESYARQRAAWLASGELPAIPRPTGEGAGADRMSEPHSESVWQLRQKLLGGRS